MDRGDEEEEDEEEEGGLAIDSIPWMASRVLGEAGASSLKGKADVSDQTSRQKCSMPP